MPEATARLARAREFLEVSIWRRYSACCAWFSFRTLSSFAMLSIIVVTDFSRRCSVRRKKVARFFSPPPSRNFESSSAGASDASRFWKYPTIWALCSLAASVSITLRTLSWLRKKSRRSDSTNVIVSWVIGASWRSSTGAPLSRGSAGRSVSQKVFRPTLRLISHDAPDQGCAWSTGLSTSRTAPWLLLAANIPAMLVAISSGSEPLFRSTSVAAVVVFSCSTDAKARVSGWPWVEVKRRTALASIS
mmetsp:Transcript_8875/g.27528  ORF Transcript_8875/g.27528 Transcript_8875/m.27528 type:complete len:247 (-) Transcript_8875:412-1152(-)